MLYTRLSRRLPGEIPPPSSSSSSYTRDTSRLSKGEIASSDTQDRESISCLEREEDKKKKKEEEKVEGVKEVPRIGGERKKVCNQVGEEDDRGRLDVRDKEEVATIATEERTNKPTEQREGLRVSSEQSDEARLRGEASTVKDGGGHGEDKTEKRVTKKKKKKDEEKKEEKREGEDEDIAVLRPETAQVSDGI